MVKRTRSWLSVRSPRVGHSPPVAHPLLAHGSVWLIAVLFTLLNAAKPLTVDDWVYVQFARHIAANPADPYGFRLWDAQPANEVLAPPAFLYWWALGIALFGEQPLAWKLWLFPITWLFCAAVHRLLCRVAPRLATPGLAFIVGSSTVLPCLNLMLDVPALALGLTALLLFWRSVEGGSTGGILIAGVLAGVAAQTKYTALLVPVLMLALALQHRRTLLGVMASALAVAIFVGWEGVMALKYGESHFLLGHRQFHDSHLKKLNLILPLVRMVGSACTAGILLAAAARRATTARQAGLLGLLLTCFAVVALVPNDWASWAGGNALQRVLQPASLLFAAMGIVWLVLIGLAGWRLWHPPSDEPPTGAPAANPDPKLDRFLVTWLLIEIGGTLLLSPYPAVRRLLGVFLSASCVCLRLGTRDGVLTRRNIWGLVLISLIFGLFSFAADLELYHAEQSLVETLTEELRAQSPAGVIWHQGGGAFDFYAERAGLRRLLISEQPLAEGDVVLSIQRPGPAGGPPPWLRQRCHVVDRRSYVSRLPLRSTHQYGRAALAAHSEPLVTVWILQVASRRQTPHHP